MSPIPQSSTSLGQGKGTTLIFPHSSGERPRFRLWKVMVSTAGSTSAPPRPVGMSQASTGRPKSLAHPTISLIGGLRLAPGPVAPAPRRQSTSKPRASTSGCMGQTLIRTPKSEAVTRASPAVSPLEEEWLASTEASPPDWLAMAAATKPSPPLFPGPHRKRMGAPPDISMARFASASPAARMSNEASMPMAEAFRSRTATSSHSSSQQAGSVMLTSAYYASSDSMVEIECGLLSPYWSTK